MLPPECQVQGANERLFMADCRPTRSAEADPLLSLAQRRINVRSGSWDRHSLAHGGTRRASSGRATLAVWPPPSTQLYR